MGLLAGIQLRDVRNHVIFFQQRVHNEDVTLLPSNSLPGPDKLQHTATVGCMECLDNGYPLPSNPYVEVDSYD